MPKEATNNMDGNGEWRVETIGTKKLKSQTTRGGNEHLEKVDSMQN